MELITNQHIAQALKLNRSAFIASWLKRMLCINGINYLHKNAQPDLGVNYVDNILSQLAINVNIAEEELMNIPAEGPFVVVSNHPTGALDGLILIKIIAAKRPDVKFFGNFLLSNIENLKSFFIAVNPFENKQYNNYNLSGLRMAKQHIAHGGPLVIFPAGEVSAFKYSSFKISDKAWNPTTAEFIGGCKVPVLPLYISGSNSVGFNLLGCIHPALRTLKLASELTNKKGTHIKVNIGRLIQPEEFVSISAESFASELRASVYNLVNKKIR